MFYYLTEEQFFKLWHSITNDDDIIQNNFQEALDIRKKLWYDKFNQKYHNNVSYTENLIGKNDTDGLFGILYGKQKYINWFILSELT